MNVLVINNVALDHDNPKRGAYVNRITAALAAAGCRTRLLIPRRPARSLAGKIWWYLVLYRDLLTEDFDRYDLLYINHFSFVALPLLLKQRKIRRALLHWHGEDMLPSKPWQPALFRLLWPLIPARFMHVTPSYYFRDKLLEKLPDTEVLVSPSGGIDMNAFRGKQPAAGQVVSLAYASGLDEGKGSAVVRQAMESVASLEQRTGRRIVFNFIDFGPAQGAWLDLVSRDPQRIVAHDPIQPDAMAGFYQANDVLLFPTRREAESLGLVCLEAMACGLPVIAPDAFACPEYVEPGVSGELFEPGNQDDFCDKLVRCIDSLDRYRPRQVVEDRYSTKAVIRGYQDMLNRLEEQAT